MENPMAAQVHYSEYQRQTVWLNEENWKFEAPARRYRVRAAVAHALVALASLLAPTKQEARTA